MAKGVYAVGRGELDRRGRWMAACSAAAREPCSAMGARRRSWALVRSATASWRSRCARRPSGAIQGLRVHRRPRLRDEDVGFYDRIPVTSPAQTLIDLAADRDRMTVERMVDEADRLDLISPPQLRGGARASILASEAWRGCGPGSIGAPFGSRARASSASFCRWRRDVGLPVPETKVWVNGFEVDFLWREPRLVVETDSLRHHRTPAQQLGITVATRRTPLPDTRRCASPTSRSATSPNTCGRSWATWHGASAADGRCAA